MRGTEKAVQESDGVAVVYEEENTEDIEEFHEEYEGEENALSGDATLGDDVHPWLSRPRSGINPD